MAPQGAKQGWQLDHVVLLIPYDTLKNPPAWITDNFTLSPGGKHGDNKTENRLVLFSDATYLELISFIDDDPEKRKGHWWDKPFGVVDFALTTSEELDYEGLLKRLEDSGTGITYSEQKQGGRVTNGKNIRWQVTFPRGIERGYVPFFCEDVTDRQWRVPVTKEATTHPCGALGVSGLILHLQKDQLDRLSQASAAILGVEKDKNGRYEIGVPNEVENLVNPAFKLQEASKDSTTDLELTLVLQTQTETPQDPIREDIDGGVVRIDFERKSI